MTKLLVKILVLCALLAFLPYEARAEQPLSEDLRALNSSDRTKVESAVNAILARRDAQALSILVVLLDDKLQVDANGVAYKVSDGGKLVPLIEGTPETPVDPKTPLVDNRLRRALEPAIASLRLGAADKEVRLEAATDLTKRRNDELAPVVQKALASEKDAEVREKLELALAALDLESPDPRLKLRALRAIESAADPAFKLDVERVLQKSASGEYVEKNADIRLAAQSAQSAIELRALWFGLIGHLFYGLSLGSVLLLAALGLAITFGLMRVINMAHGELLMIGAYSTYVVQKLFQEYLPGQSDWYLVCAIPVAFAVCTLIGMALERSVLRFFYGRPLETLLATWGISLILIQTVRLIFGAQNVTVANPSWLAGGAELLPGFVLTYSRVAVIAFSGVVVVFVWFMLQRTPLGLHVRAVTQNREMAASMGISTRRVDLWTFGIGSGVAGLGGVALSQLGNVGPELGQGYIVDSFMVVVLGGVGKLAGTLAGAFGLGIVNKLLEPVAGAVLGKIAILVFIILFIQRRPQGIFALKGRAAEVS
jgi:urea transport system permease protein